jgi:hypothetical protein
MDSRLVEKLAVGCQRGSALVVQSIVDCRRDLKLPVLLPRGLAVLLQVLRRDSSVLERELQMDRVYFQTGLAE